MAGVVLGVTMVPVLFLFPSGARQTAFGEAQLGAHLRARTLMAAAIDRAVRTGFEQLPAASELDGTGAESTVFEPVMGYPGLWQVTVGVEWELPAEMGGGKRRYALRRLLHRSEHGLVGDWPLTSGRAP